MTFSSVFRAYEEKRFQTDRRVEVTIQANVKCRGRANEKDLQISTLESTLKKTQTILPQVSSNTDGHLFTLGQVLKYNHWESKTTNGIQKCIKLHR